jgi:hypothetical protein
VSATRVNWVRSERVLWRQTTAGVVALGSKADDPVVITGAGVLLWELLEEPFPADDLYEAIKAVHDVPLSTVLEELAPIVAELLRLGVLETCP